MKPGIHLALLFGILKITFVTVYSDMQFWIFVQALNKPCQG